MVPNLSIVCWTAALHSSWTATLHLMSSLFEEFDSLGRMSRAAILAPCDSRIARVAAPIPDEAPVMMTT